MRRFFLLCWAVCCLFLCAAGASASEAEEISDPALVAERSGVANVRQLFDGRAAESVTIRQGGWLTLRHSGGLGSLYLVFGQEPDSYTVRNDASGETVTLGENQFLHEFLDLEAAFGTAPRQVTITFDKGKVQLSELNAFGPGKVPDHVQQWLPPAEGCADLALFSTHGDDEQLFFAGMLPYYASELDYEVQVVYFTGHRNAYARVHEMLDGLWAVGVRRYPVFGPYGDYKTGSLEEAYRKYGNKGDSKEEMLSFVVENVRRFRPKVAVGHDLEGEYGHGMHMLYADLLCQAVEISGDAEQYPESAGRYGVWDVPKTYLHLYPENPIVMDWDVPLQSFDGMTAYEVTRDLGFPCHSSQVGYYSWYFKGKDTAAEIGEYSPREFGLYRSTVGEDAVGGDFFENVNTHARDAALEEERRAEEEMALRLAEEAARETIPEPAATEPVPLAEEPEGFSLGQLWAKILAFFRDLFTGKNI